MRWTKPHYRNPPQLGEVRTREYFAWWPVRDPHTWETFWLCRVKTTESCCTVGMRYVSQEKVTLVEWTIKKVEAA